MNTDFSASAASFAYFADCSDPKAIKTRFRELVMIHHPDRGCDTATMQEINAQYEAAMRASYAQDEKTAESVDWWMEQEQAMMEVLALLAQAGLVDLLTVELLGVWLWVSGETRPHKECLKACGLFWSQQKAAWYWRSPVHRVPRRAAPNRSLDELRSGFGSKEFAPKFASQTAGKTQPAGKAKRLGNKQSLSYKPA
jgi:hypothetical protein